MRPALGVENVGPNSNVGIFWWYTGSSDRVNAFKKLKHGSIITGCWDIHWSVHLVLAGAHFSDISTWNKLAWWRVMQMVCNTWEGWTCLVEPVLKTTNIKYQLPSRTVSNIFLNVVLIKSTRIWPALYHTHPFRCPCSNTVFVHLHAHCAWTWGVSI